MLKEPLPIKIKGTEERQVVVELKDVLVVDHLPVPLHISTKHPYIEEAGNSIQAWGSFLGSLRGLGPRAEGKVHFPTKYQSHPYWDLEDKTIYLGLYSHCLD